MWKHLIEKSIILPKISAMEIDEQVEPVLREMERIGIKIDIEKMQKLSKKLTSKVLNLQKTILKLSGEDFNLDSPIQLSEILFTKLKLPTKDLKRTKNGVSTAASELKKIESKNSIIAPILEYRELKKLLTTYLTPLPAMVDKDNRLHTTYGQDTVTGRLTSSDPNLQNIPIKGEWGQEIRSFFIAGKGYKLISADYSQIELRVVACLAEDETMIEAFKSGQDIHSRTASEIFNIDIKKVTEAERRVAKTVNFGVLYGMSPYGLSQALNIDQNTATKYIYDYFEAHKGIKKYCERMVNTARAEGFVETLFGLKRGLSNINSPYRNIAEAEERMAINTPVQGTASEILKLAMVELDHKLKSQISNLKSQNYGARLLLTVHDELVVEVPENQAKDVAKIIKQTMEGVIKLCVPIEVEVRVGESWEK